VFDEENAHEKRVQNETIKTATQKIASHWNKDTFIQTIRTYRVFTRSISNKFCELNLHSSGTRAQNKESAVSPGKHITTISCRSFRKHGWRIVRGWTLR